MDQAGWLCVSGMDVTRNYVVGLAGGCHNTINQRWDRRYHEGSEMDLVALMALTTALSCVSCIYTCCYTQRSIAWGLVLCGIQDLLWPGLVSFYTPNSIWFGNNNLHIT